MSRFFQRQSIKTKLILAIFGAATLVSVSAFLFEISVVSTSLRDEAIEQTHSEMRVLGQDFVKVALFSDVDLAADVVAKLRSLPQVHNVFLYNKGGRVVFNYQKSSLSEMAPPQHLLSSAQFKGGFLRMYLPVEYAGSQYGHVFVRVSTERLEEKLADYYRLLAAAVPVLLLVSYLMALWLQRYFSTPIVTLAERVSQIADQQDFSARLTSTAANEIGSLYRSFDQLLQTIQISQEKLRQSEARLAAIIDIAGSAIVSIDESHRIILFNRLAEEVFGYSADEVLGKSINMLIPEVFRAGHDEYIDGFGAGDESLRTAASRPDARGLRKHGEDFLLEASISHMQLEGRKIYTVAINDITERRRVEQELESHRLRLEEMVEERTAELQEKNRDLESFSYTVAHDLRAPLRSIISFGQILQKESAAKLDPEEMDYLGRVVNAGQHMSMLIDGILKLARIGRSSMQIDKVSLSAVAIQMKERLTRAEPERTVEWKIQDGLVVEGDAQMLRLVMENLIENAWKYTSKKAQANIEFGTETIDGRRAFFVRDSGAGFDMKYADNLFGVFQRLHTSNDFEGTGIGLATVRRIIQRHGGEVWAEGEPGVGASFFFTLPGAGSRSLDSA